MNWKGKRAIFLGDSITEGALASCPEDVYHQIVGRELGFSKTINCGKSGTRIARQREPSENPSFDMDFNHFEMFLEKRRYLMAQKIRSYYDMLRS